MSADIPSVNWLRIARLVLVLLVLPVVAIGWYVTQPGLTRNRPSKAVVDPTRLRAHVVALSEQFYPRSFNRPDNLDRCAAYIGGHFAAVGANVSTQEYVVLGRTYRNVIGYFGAEGYAKVIVGAHYDACGEKPGADDNASGVAGLLELARLIGSSGTAPAVELVAYSTEEPPFFATENMGSVHHAQQVRDSGREIRQVIVLEMIGFFSDEPRSQMYPAAIFKLFFPGRGDFIGVVGRPADRREIRRVRDLMRGATELPVRSAAVPALVPGVDYSDHRSYWPHGVPAVMITDTAFFRNGEYHKQGDTADRLDYDRMGKVVVSVYEAVTTLAESARP